MTFCQIFGTYLLFVVIIGFGIWVSVFAVNCQNVSTKGLRLETRDHPWLVGSLLVFSIGYRYCSFVTINIVTTNNGLTQYQPLLFITNQDQPFLFVTNQKVQWKIEWKKITSFFTNLLLDSVSPTNFVRAKSILSKFVFRNTSFSTEIMSSFVRESVTTYFY